MIDWTINFGHLITIALILFAGAGFYYRQLFDSKVFKEDIVEIKSDLKILNKLVTDVALQNQRLDQMDVRHDTLLNMLNQGFSELRRGEGYITAQAKKAVTRSRS